MRITRAKTPARHRRFRLSSLRRLQREEDGATAIEFAIVATPFLMFIFALIGCAFYFFMMNSVEKGMDQSGRLIRTGQAVSSKMTVNQFKQKICDGAGAMDQLQQAADLRRPLSQLGCRRISTLHQK